MVEGLVGSPPGGSQLVFEGVRVGWVELVLGVPWSAYTTLGRHEFMTEECRETENP